MKAKVRRRLYARNCARKVVYRHLAEAAWAAERGDDGLYPYRCPMGPHYHVGHSSLPRSVVDLQPTQHPEHVIEVHRDAADPGPASPALPEIGVHRVTDRMRVTVSATIGSFVGLVGRLRGRVD